MRLKPAIFLADERRVSDRLSTRPDVLLHGWLMHLGLSLIEPHSRVPVDVLDEAVEEDDPVLLAVFSGVVPLAAEESE